jgi:stress-induced morphogen
LATDKLDENKTKTEMHKMVEKALASPINSFIHAPPLAEIKPTLPA